VARWALRLLRREWRQQALVLALLALVVAASVAFTSAAYNTAGVADDATFGSAQHRYEADVSGSVDLAGVVTAAEGRLGAVDVSVSWHRPVPGLTEVVELRSQDPEGTFSAPLLGLRQGRYPVADGEAALTDGLADVLGLGVGDRLDLDGRDRRVVGLVENPSDLSADFALVSPDDTDRAEVVTILVGGGAGGDAALDEEIRALQAFGAEHLGENAVFTSRSTGPDDVAIAGGVLGITAVALLLVGLVASAGFVVVAQRRMRQLGVMGALGATERHLRLVVVVDGVAVGILASLLGGAVGIGSWVAFASGMEEAVGHRIDPGNVPWWALVGPMALTAAAATVAAWWPARVVARVPVTSALSGRPTTPRPVRRSAAAAGALLAVGVVSLARADASSPVLLMAGTAATAAGVLLVAPVALRAVARLATRLPVALRLAMRDLARYPARSGIALAAVSLTLGVPAAIVVASTAAEASAPLGNLPDDQLLVWTRDPGQPDGVSPYYTEDPEDDGFSPYLPRLAPGDLEDKADAIERIADGLDALAVTPLELVTDTRAESTPDGRLAVSLALPTDGGSLDVAPLFLASDRLLEAHGIDPADAGAGPAVLTVPDLRERLPGEARDMLVGDELHFSNTADRPQPVGAVRPLDHGYSSFPGSLITAGAAGQRGWEPVTVGWLVDAPAPVTGVQVGHAREIAAGADLLVEPPHREASLVGLRWGATATALVVALGVLAATVGLLRRETEADLRTLAAAGASSGIRRTLAATTCGGLALLGAAIGTAGAYAGLAAGHVGDLHQLVPVPVVHLVAIGVGIPASAAAASWLLAGREPSTLARPVIE
jgi:putative ABC transport system permease protein